MSTPVEKFLEKQLGKQIDKQKLINLLKTETLNLHEIADRFQVPLLTVRETIQKLTDLQVMIKADGETYSVIETPEIGGKRKLNPDWWYGKKLRFGFISDNHLGSKFERLDVLHGLYDIFEREELPIVFNGGNWIEGEARFNKHEIHKHGIDEQMEYAVATYPYKKGMETHFISGDDHEGWYNQNTGINSGRYFQMLRELNGMNDLKHLGYVEADIELHHGQYENPLWLRVMHPGGGSAYAHSYAPQKIVESLQGGEKPHILLIGHFHKGSYNMIRNVHTVQMLCTKDQDIFMRKKKIEAHLGGGIIELTIDPSGMITDFLPRFFTYFDKKFYEGSDKYWK